MEEIVMLTSADNPPYEFTKSGEIVGFDVDLAKVIAEKLGRKLVLKDMSFASLIPAIVSKQGDFAMAAIEPTNPREKNVDLSISYHIDDGGVVTTKKEFELMGSGDGVFTFDMLAGKTIGVQLGTTQETKIKESNILGLTMRRYDNIGTMIAEISNSANGNGTLHAIILDYAAAKELARKNSKLCAFAVPQLGGHCAIALPKRSPLTEEINKIIELLKNTGELSAIEKKWWPEKE
ncbi:MAG: ABC transporter substrate-binding protein [Puniceicoccales bacterium]|jgi:polar amino acid transport system substrate-binding protein|nr:ABC transporter substrate-binding protein [Puniceicoccales bacterium]